MKGYCFVDGEITETKNAKIAISDIGFLRGFAIYEGITSVGTTPVFLAEHLDRLEKSAALVGLSLPYNRTEMTDIIEQMAAHVTAPRGDIRLVLTGGASPDGLNKGEKGSFVVIANNLQPLGNEIFENGCKIMTHEYMRFLPQCKTTHYTAAVMLQEEKRRRGATEIVYVYGGNVLEGATSNICVVKDGVLITPKENILRGITRMKTLELTTQLAVPYEERAITQEELLGADEVFLTSSFKDILPVVHVDDVTIANGAVGPVTKRFIDAYADLLARQGSGAAIIQEVIPATA